MFKVIFNECLERSQLDIEVLTLFWLLLLLFMLWLEILLLLFRLWLFVWSFGPCSSFVNSRPLFFDHCSIRSRCRWLRNIGLLRRRRVQSLLQTREKWGNGGRGGGELSPTECTGGSLIKQGVIATRAGVRRLRVFPTLVHCEVLLESFWRGTTFDVQENFDMERSLRRGQLHSSFLQQDKTSPQVQNA